MNDDRPYTSIRQRISATRAVACVCLYALAIGLPTGAQQRPWLDEVTSAVGVTFTHVNDAHGEFRMPENLGAGVALIDYDLDGDLDVFFVQGERLGGGEDGRTGGREDRRHRLFRNDLTVAADGTRRVAFTDVTAQAGLAGTGYGMGVAVGDYDGDGWPDLYVTAFGANVLYRNAGDGTFADVTAAAGVEEPRWSMSAAFVDIDRDGHLDLFVANYLDFSLTANKPCFEAAGSRDYCAPTTYRPVPDRLFRNRGDGTFEDISERAGILSAFGNGLGVSTGDYDRDGHLDIYVANDATPNQLWRNLGNGRFEDLGPLSGAAFNAAGRPEGSMGIASGDYDSDGDEDLVVTNIIGETFALYENDGAGGFEDRRVPAGLSQPTAMMTGFGTEWADFDNDGALDLFIANGAVNLVPELRGSANPYRQRNQVFRGSRIADRGSGIADRGSRIGDHGSVRLDELTGAAAGPAFELLEVSRGVAIGDLDNDGFPDVVLTNNGGAARVLRNTAASSQQWIGFDLHQPGPNRYAIGATLILDAGPAAGTVFRVRTDGSYLSASDARVLVGMGAHTSPVTATVTWPDGTSQKFGNLTPGQYHRLTRR